MVVAEAKGQDEYQIFSFKHASEVSVSEIWQKMKLPKPFQRQESTYQDSPTHFQAFFLWADTRRLKDLSSIISMPKAA